ncbi:MAG: hypothetical protein K2X32_09770, partial [Phycisphaerales bacterium]|nr:hypothetical protein [Phycisphaerales bacterium]
AGRAGGGGGGGGGGGRPRATAGAQPGFPLKTNPSERDEAFEYEARRREASNELNRLMGDAGERGRLLVLTWSGEPTFARGVWTDPAIVGWLERNGVLFDATAIGNRRSIGIERPTIGGFEMFLRSKRLSNIMPSEEEGMSGGGIRGHKAKDRVTSLASAVVTYGALQRAMREALQKDSLFRAAHEKRLKDDGFVLGRWLFGNTDQQLVPVEDAPEGAGIDFVLARLNEARVAKAEKEPKKAWALMTWLMERSERCEPAFVAARLLVVSPELRTLGDHDVAVRARAVALGGGAYVRLCDQRSRLEARAMVEFEIAARTAAEFGDYLLSLYALINMHDDRTDRFNGDLAVARYVSERMTTSPAIDPQSIFAWLKSAGPMLESSGPPQLLQEERERLIASRRWLFALEACRAHKAALEAGDAALADEIVRFASAALPAATRELDVRRWVVCVALAIGKANARHEALLEGKSGAVDPLLARVRLELGSVPEVPALPGR